VGGGGRGEITERIQKMFFEITKGERQAPGDWLTFVKASKSMQPENNGSQSRTEADKQPAVSSPAGRRAEPVMKYQTATIATE
jgi:hypothetical protein